MANTLRLSEDEFRVIFDRMNKNARAPEPAPAAAVALPRGPSAIEAVLAQQIAVLRLPEPVREYQAIPDRKFRLDFAWPDLKVGVEVQGMVHRIKGRFLRDTEKACLHILHGWRVLPVSGQDVRSGRAAAWVTALLESVGAVR